MDTAGHDTILYNFTDGFGPNGRVTLDSDGNFYGTGSGGANGIGVVYKVDTAGHAKVFYAFTGGVDGANPTAGVVRDAAGNLYGTANGGATGNGVVFKVSPAGGETPLYTFAGGVFDGFFPSASVIRDAAGNLYGTTQGGGAAGLGVVYKVDTAGHESLLHSFTGGSSDGTSPTAGLFLDSEGNLYGTAGGGASGQGVIFEVDHSGSESVLYSFPGGNDGYAGFGEGVVRDKLGNLYGTASGGPFNQGVVYALNRAGQEIVLCGFPSPPDGGDPQAGVIRDSAGTLYGTTSPLLGIADQGTVYHAYRNCDLSSVDCALAHLFALQFTVEMLAKFVLTVERF